MQILAVVFGVWLGAYDMRQGTLLTIDEVGSTLNGKLIAAITEHISNLNTITVPVNVKDRDIFHITTEEYLLALTDLIEELVSVDHDKYPDIH